MNWLIYVMVYLGSVLMIYNICSFVQYARHLQEKKDWGKERTVLYVPIFLLIFFLLGYLVVGIFGKPDLVVSGILFGGSIFVFIITKLLRFITDRVQENEHLEAKVMAAEETSKNKTAFLSRVSHEMRTPMNAIRALDRPDAKTIPIIAMTANAFDEDVQRSLQAGMTAHLSKPVEPDRLFDTLAKLAKA